MAKFDLVKSYDKEFIEVLNGMVANLPEKKTMLLEIIYRKDWDKWSFVLHNPELYETACEADWMEREALLPALREMTALFEAMIKELEEEGE